MERDPLKNKLDSVHGEAKRAKEKIEAEAIDSKYMAQHIVHKYLYAIMMEYPKVVVEKYPPYFSCVQVT